MTPEQYDQVLASLYRIQRKYAGRMLVNAKCAPHYIKTVLEHPAPGPIHSPRLARRQRLRTAEGGASWPGQSPIRTYSGGAGGCPAGTHYMGIRPNGDVTPCPYLPVFAGTLRQSSLADLWTSSELFTDIRRRTSLGGRCGDCEMNGHCGGCRARAYGMTGDLMAEDPALHPHAGQVRRVPPSRHQRPQRRLAGTRATGRVIQYGAESTATIAWDDAAAARMKKIPAFVRGMVVRAVEESCRKNGLERVTVEELEKIRARMPTPKMFG